MKEDLKRKFKEELTSYLEKYNLNKNILNKSLKSTKIFINKELKQVKEEYKKDTTLKSAIKNNILIHLNLMIWNIERLERYGHL